GQNCTWYTHGRLMQLGYSEYALDSMLGNAGTWDNTASRGAYVSYTPRAGAIAVWEAGVNGAGSVGHVAVVERVNSDGTILISESNWAGRAYNTRTISASNPSKFVIVPSNTSIPSVPADGAGNSTSSARDIGTLTGTRSFSDFVGSADTNDYYRFYVDSTSNFSLSLTGLSADADVQLLNSSGGAIVSSANGGSSSESISRQLSAGTYYARVYPFNSSNTNYNLSLTANTIAPPISSTNWKAEFFNNTSRLGSPVAVQDWGSGGNAFNKNWGYNSPVSGVSSDNFSVKATTRRYFSAGRHQIETTSDDGVRVQIGSSTVIDHLLDQPSTRRRGVFDAGNGGWFNVQVDYYERYGAANLSFGVNNSFEGETAVNGQSYGWDISKYSSNGKTTWQVDPNKTTVVVAHGRVNRSSDSVSNLEELAKTAASVFSHAQVFFLDWRNASADSGIRPVQAGKRIGSVANNVYDALRSLGLTNANNLYFYGHSLGSLLLTKVAERYGKVGGFASLDPAFTAEDYDLDNDGNSWEDELPDLKSIASRSISLVAEDIAVVGAAGDNNYAMTAHRAYIVDFGGYNLNQITDAPTKFHNAIVDVFRGMLQSGLEVNGLATDPIIRENQWGQNGSQRTRYSIGNYDADGVIGANFTNQNGDITIGGLVFVNNNDGTLRQRVINKSVRLTA
ncbi:MAG: hypothetical protein RLZZ435_1171, partial [Cyanobacteriota bacterium]